MVRPHRNKTHACKICTNKPSFTFRTNYPHLQIIMQTKEKGDNLFRLVVITRGKKLL